MCEPGTMMIAGAGLSAAGTLYGGISSNRAAKEAAAALEMQAQLRIQQGEYDAAQELRMHERDLGKKTASAAASGISLESFADVFADDAMESALARKTIRWGAQRDAANLRAQAAATKKQGKNSLIGSAFAAAGSLFSAGGKYRTAAAVY